MKIIQPTPVLVNVSAFLGILFAILAIICLLIPILTAPLYDQLSLWYGLVQLPDYNQIELYVGLWGVCVYHSITPNSTRHRIVTKSVCTPVQPAYSFQFSEVVPGTSGGLNWNQTMIFLWYPCAAVFASIGIILSLSSNFRMWRYAMGCFVIAWITTLGVFAATITILLNLETNLSPDDNNLFTSRAEIRGQTFLPSIGSLFLSVSTTLIFIRYLKASKNYRQSGCIDPSLSNSPTYWLEFSPNRSFTRNLFTRRRSNPRRSCEVDRTTITCESSRSFATTK
ncbi:hypothetical protein CROQUDRAFT_661891 [Cronartium quercuum f. sp. fusiforme G11]|uniref:Uncharacterized protein n=1 Tax=Cronartium quercuum f. sp. fusiforme G11 TaxID=708437 RepID=A0A9P6NF94_9BASI|nr:hypothetical protein CROQUDRAFT_661891 [Cronartium quercuum f. sp. fusiforme G11]